MCGPSGYLILVHTGPATRWRLYASKESVINELFYQHKTPDNFLDVLKNVVVSATRLHSNDINFSQPCTQFSLSLAQQLSHLFSSFLFKFNSDHFINTIPSGIASLHNRVFLHMCVEIWFSPQPSPQCRGDSSQLQGSCKYLLFKEEYLWCPLCSPPPTGYYSHPQVQTPQHHHLLLGHLRIQWSL